jgi:hypothetical protein
MVTRTAYSIIKKAAIIRVKRGEDIETVVNSYPKLSGEQKIQLTNELNSI